MDWLGTKSAGSLNSVCWNSSLGLWHRLCWFSVIRSRICTRLFFWIPESLRKVLKILRASLNWLDWLGNQISWFTEFSLLEQQFGSLSPFVLVLSSLELDLYSVCFFRFLTL